MMTKAKWTPSTGPDYPDFWRQDYETTRRMSGIHRSGRFGFLSLTAKTASRIMASPVRTIEYIRLPYCAFKIGRYDQIVSLFPQYTAPYQRRAIIWGCVMGL